MDGSKFDDISRKLAHRSTRRDAVRTGGFMAAVAGAFGVRSVARAQSDGENEPTPCAWTFRALVVSGPNEDTTYSGTLHVAIERDGAIDDGSLEPEEQEPYDVVGNTRGKAISLVIKLSDELSLHLTGAGSRDIKSCEAQIGGTFAGPEFGDMGVWQIERLEDSNGTGGDDDGGGLVVFPTPTVPGDGNPGPGDPSPTPGSNTTPCPADDCGVTKMWDPNQCKCVCYDNGVDCGPNTCCPTGSVCDNQGGCACPSGTIICNAACVPCTSGQFLDYTTCTCFNDCPFGLAECNGQCVGQCSPGERLNLTTCACDYVCTPPRDNCASPCTMGDSHCGSGLMCIDGTCTCPPGMVHCPTYEGCVNSNAYNPANCD